MIELASRCLDVDVLRCRRLPIHVQTVTGRVRRPEACQVLLQQRPGHFQGLHKPRPSKPVKRTPTQNKPPLRTRAACSASAPTCTPLLHCDQARVNRRLLAGQDIARPWWLARGRFLTKAVQIFLHLRARCLLDAQRVLKASQAVLQHLQHSLSMMLCSTSGHDVPALGSAYDHQKSKCSANADAATQLQRCVLTCGLGNARGYGVMMHWRMCRATLLSAWFELCWRVWVRMFGWTQCWPHRCCCWHRALPAPARSRTAPPAPARARISAQASALSFD